MVGNVGTCSSSRSMTRISAGDSARSFGVKVAIEAGSYIASRIGELLPVQNREAVDLFDDVSQMDRCRGSAALFTLRQSARRSSA